MYAVTDVELGIHDQPKITLISPDKLQSCEVYLYGCTVTSWKCSGVEKLYCSPITPFDGVAAIRGGIPLVFPQFGRPNETMPQHGFARTSTWAIGSNSCDEKSCTVNFTLNHNDLTLAVWPHPFVLQYTLTLSEAGLRTTFRATNIGDADFECQALLHTYIAVQDIQHVSVEGFCGLTFHDKMDPPNGAFPVDERAVANIDKEVDRIYLGPACSTDKDGDEFSLPVVKVLAQTNGASPEVVLLVRRKAYLKHHGSEADKSLPTDCVLWNAWVAKCKAIGDLEDDAYMRYVCVEPGVCSRFETVAPGETLVLDQYLTV